MIPSTTRNYLLGVATLIAATSPVLHANCCGSGGGGGGLGGPGGGGGDRGTGRHEAARECQACGAADQGSSGVLVAI